MLRNSNYTISVNENRDAGPALAHSMLDGPITRRRLSMMQDFKPSELTPIDSLPNEILLKIFSFLDRVALKNTLLVDRRFNKIITQSSATMARLPLTVGLFKGPENHAVKAFNRRYRKVEFQEIVRNKWFKYVKQGLTDVGGNVNEVTFKNCQLPPEGIADILSSFPNLEKLNITSLDGFAIMESRSGDPPLDPKLFPKLKDIRLRSVKTILKSFVNIKLKLLQVFRLEGEDWKHLADLVRNQTHLNTLTLIDNGNIPEDLEIISLRPEQTFQTLNFLFVNNIRIEKFIEFLMCFVNKVHYLTIVCVEQSADSHKIFETVLEQFTNLHGLAVDFDNFPTNEQFYRNLETARGVNRTLQNLAINCRYLNNPHGFRSVFRIHPAIRYLSISIVGMGEDMKAEDFAFMFETLKNLRSFYLVLSRSSGLSQGFFKNITSLNIIHMHCDVNWQELARNSPNLRTVAISKISPGCSFDLSELVRSLSQLMHLEIGSGFKFNKAQMKILQKAPMLKSLKMLKSSWTSKSSPQEILECLNMESLKIIMQSVPYENVSFYANTFFFKSV